jgi:hypothetical protein
MVNEYHAKGRLRRLPAGDVPSLSSAKAPVDEEGFKKVKAEELTEQVYEAAMATYARHNQTRRTQAMPVITDVFLNQGQQYENIVVPITDGLKTMQVVANLQRPTRARAGADRQRREVHHPRHHRQRVEGAPARDGRTAPERAERQHRAEGPAADLQTGELQPVQGHDRAHQRRYGRLPGKAGLARGTAPGAGGTCTPRARSNGCGDQPHGGAAIQLLQCQRPSPHNGSSRSRSRTDATAQQAPPARPATPVRVDKAPGRNDPCPCGSGKKYKQCHGQGELFIPLDLSWPISSKASGYRNSFIPPNQTQRNYQNEKSNYGRFNLTIGAGVSFGFPISSTYVLSIGPVVSLGLFDQAATTSDVRLYNYSLMVSLRRRVSTPRFLPQD